MSRQVLLFSDIHVHPHKRSQKRLEDCLAALEWVFQTAEDRDIKDILFGGDLFHDRQKIEVYTYQRVFEVFAKWMCKKKFNIYLLLGNHDLWFNEKTSVSSVTPLSALPGVRIVSNPERLNIADTNWDFIPFTHNPVATLAELRDLPGQAEYALGHIAIDGAILHGTQQADVAIEHDGDMIRVNPSIFADYKHTFLGHYHAEQMVNSKVEYIGSPLELSFGEAYQTKHIILFDGQTGEKEYIVNSFSPKHLVIKPEEREKFDLEGNYVQIRVNDIGATDLIKLKKEMAESVSMASLEIKKQKKAIDEHVIHDAKAILYRGDEMLARYADQVGHEGLNRERLLNLGKLICQKVEQS